MYAIQIYNFMSQRKVISVKKQVYLLMALAIAWAIAFVCLFITAHWVCGIIVVLAPFAIEYALRCYKSKRIILPFTAKEKPAKPRNISLITKISELTVAQYRQCHAYDDLNVLDKWKESGCDQATHGEIKSNWIDICSQVQQAIQDPATIKRLKLMAKKTAYELRQTIYDKYMAMLKTMYSPTIADMLRQAFPKYKLHLDTLDSDMRMIATEMKRSKRENDLTLKELAILNEGGEISNTPEAKEQDIDDTLIEIRKYEGVNYDETKMTMLTYCRCINRLHKHIEHLKEQAAKR